MLVIVKDASLPLERIREIHNAEEMQDLWIYTSRLSAAGPQISLALFTDPGHQPNCIFRHFMCFTLIFRRIVNELNKMKMKR